MLLENISLVHAPIRVSLDDIPHQFALLLCHDPKCLSDKAAVINQFAKYIRIAREMNLVRNYIFFVVTTDIILNNFFKTLSGDNVIVAIKLFLWIQDKNADFFLVAGVSQNHVCGGPGFSPISFSQNTHMLNISPYILL